MKVTKESAEFQRVTVVLETEEDVMSLYRITCNGLYSDLSKKYSGDILTNVIDFKAGLHRALKGNIPEGQRVY